MTYTCQQLAPDYKVIDSDCSLYITNTPKVREFYRNVKQDADNDMQYTYHYNFIGKLPVSDVINEQGIMEIVSKQLFDETSPERKAITRQLSNMDNKKEIYIPLTLGLKEEQAYRKTLVGEEPVLIVGNVTYKPVESIDTEYEAWTQAIVDKLNFMN
jgi:hypothetical protein